MATQLLLRVIHNPLVTTTMRLGTSFVKKHIVNKIEADEDKIVHTIYSSMGIVNLTPGERAFPKERALDPKLGFRFDWGALFRDPQNGHWYRSVDIQINSNAELKTLRDAARGGGSHVKRVTICVACTQAGIPLMTEAQFKDLWVQEVYKELRQKGL